MSNRGSGSVGDPVFDAEYRAIFGRNPESWREPLGALRLTLAGDPSRVDVERAQEEMEALVRALNGGVA